MAAGASTGTAVASMVELQIIKANEIKKSMKKAKRKEQRKKKEEEEEQARLIRIKEKRAIKDLQREERRKKKDSKTRKEPLKISPPQEDESSDSTGSTSTSEN